MPRFKPRPPEPEPDDGSITFGYMKIQASSGHMVHAMTFDQIRDLLDEISDLNEVDEEPAGYHFDRIRRLLKRCERHG